MQALRVVRYISKEEREFIKNFPILIGGEDNCVVIAECALRLGFETITIINKAQIKFSKLLLRKNEYKESSMDNIRKIVDHLLSI